MSDPVPQAVREARTAIERLVADRARVLRESREGLIDRRALTRIDERIGEVLDRLRIDPGDAPADLPLVLLPVRLETRFKPQQAGAPGPVLQVRIYPDEIHVDALRRGLTDAETAAGQAYWVSAWTDPVPGGAWQTLVEAVGSQRAEWVAHACTPENLAQRGTGTPTFPSAASSGTPAARGGVLARALPDRFVVVAVQGPTVTKATGKTVPPDLQMNPIPTGKERPSTSSGAAGVAGKLAVPPGSEWLVEYKAALEKGMAVEVELPSAAPVDRLYAIGVQVSAEPQDAARELAELLESHRFGDGLALLPQGTATNSADPSSPLRTGADRSPYRRRTTPTAPPLTPAAAPDGSDTSALAQLLGLDADLLAGLLGPGEGEQEIAEAANAALWAPGWGEYLRRLDERGVPGPDDRQREDAREMFRDTVRGRGPAPAVRVGAQPYGVLPVCDLRRWKHHRGEPLAGLDALLLRLLKRWVHAARNNVPVIRPGQPGIDQKLLQVMGTSPVMQALRVRPVVSDDVSEPVIAAIGTGSAERRAELEMIQAVVASHIGLGQAPKAGKAKFGSLHEDTRPLPLPLVSERDAEFIDALLGSPSQILEIDSVLQALLAIAYQVLEDDVERAAPAVTLLDTIELSGLDRDLKLKAAQLMAQPDETPPSHFLAFAEALPGKLGGPAMLREYQPLEGLQTSLAEVALSSAVTEDARGFAIAAVSAWAVARAARADAIAGMRRLQSTGLEQRGLAVAEALDLSSHRLDAWITALVTERARRQADGRGLTIGAYGVVEHLAPSPMTPERVEEWIHAPSTTHAITAGMLRSSHLAHLPQAGADTGPFAIDLSSSRLQSATHVIDGVRQGQTLAALIGYQIERGLAERGLARLQQSLRALAPLVAGRLNDRDSLDPVAVQEAIAANNVVDGLLLLKKYPVTDSASLPSLVAALNVPPQNVYIPPGGWPAMTAAETHALGQVLRAAADTVDAVADTMLSEAVLQYASGNAGRAAAAMDAMSSGATAADTIDVLEARDSADRLTHRALAVVGTHSTGWSTTRPRAVAEPRLEAWAARVLGRPRDTVVAVVGGELVTLADADLAALDLVFAPDAQAVDRTLRYALPEIGDTPLASMRGLGWPAALRPITSTLALAQSLRACIAGSRPVTPEDLVRPGERAVRSLATARPELEARLQQAVGLLQAAVTSLAGPVAAIPEEQAQDADLASAAQALDGLGIPLSPVPERPLDVSWVRHSWMIADSRLNAAVAAMSQLSSLPADASQPQLLDAAETVAEAVFGDGFVVVPLLTPVTGDPLVTAVSQPAFPQPTGSQVRRFLTDQGTVRAGIRRWSEVLLLAGALGGSSGVSVVQLTPSVAGGAPAPGATTWLAGPRAGEPWPDAPSAHLLLDITGSADGPVAGIVLDSWVESLPEQGPDASKPQRARTGLAIRANSASARPPQSILVAISPDGARWTVDSIVGVLDQTLDLAKARLVTLERLAGDALVLPALYVRSASLQGEQYLAFHELADIRFTAAPYIKELSR